MKKVVICTGGFDPLHSGHIEYFRAARELGDKLVVGLNSDNWLARKKGRAFMPWEERASIIAALHNVDRVIIEAKANGITVADELKRLYKTANWQVDLYNPGAYDKVARVYSVQPIFANAQVFAPDKAWAENLIAQFEVFPKGKHDDGVDSTSQALRWLRDRGLLMRQEELAAIINQEGSYEAGRKKKVVYDV